MSEIINILLFKITAVASFIMIMLEPVFDFIVDSFTNVLLAAKSFIEGFIEVAGNIFEPLEDIYNMIMDIAKSLGLADDKTGLLTKTFRILGALIGGIVRPALELIAQTIDTIGLGIKGLINNVKLAKAFISGDKKGFAQIQEQMKRDDADFEKRTKRRFRNVQESMGRSDKVIGRELGFTPKAEAKTSTTNLNVEPITVNVTEGNAQKAGEDFGKGLQKKLIDQDVLSGGRR